MRNIVSILGFSKYSQSRLWANHHYHPYSQVKRPSHLTVFYSPRLYITTKKKMNNQNISNEYTGKSYLEWYRCSLKLQFDYLLDPFEQWWKFPSVSVDNGTQTIRENTGDVVSETSTCNMSYPFHSTSADYVKYLCIYRESHETGNKCDQLFVDQKTNKPASRKWQWVPLKLHQE